MHRITSVLGVLCLGACGGSSDDLHRRGTELLIHTAGTGQGTVEVRVAYSGGTETTSCGDGCVVPVSGGQEVELTLTPVPAAGSRFVGWQPCDLSLTEMPSSGGPTGIWTTWMVPEDEPECTAVFELIPSHGFVFDLLDTLMSLIDCDVHDGCAANCVSHGENTFLRVIEDDGSSEARETADLSASAIATTPDCAPVVGGSDGLDPVIDGPAGGFVVEGAGASYVGSLDVGEDATIVGGLRRYDSRPVVFRMGATGDCSAVALDVDGGWNAPRVAAMSDGGTAVVFYESAGMYDLLGRLARVDPDGQVAWVLETDGVFHRVDETSTGDLLVVGSHADAPFVGLVDPSGAMRHVYTVAGAGSLRAAEHAGQVFLGVSTDDYGMVAAAADLAAGSLGPVAWYDLGERGWPYAVGADDAGVRLAGGAYATAPIWQLLQVGPDLEPPACGTALGGDGAGLLELQPCGATFAPGTIAAQDLPVSCSARSFAWSSSDVTGLDACADP